MGYHFEVRDVSSDLCSDWEIKKDYKYYTYYKSKTFNTIDELLDAYRKLLTGESIASYPSFFENDILMPDADELFTGLLDTFKSLCCDCGDSKSIIFY